MRVPKLLVLLLVATRFASRAEARTWSWSIEAGTPAEKAVILEDRARTFVLEGFGRRVRNVDGTAASITYRFGLAAATKARARLEMLNNYLVSASSDGRAWREVLRNRTFASGASNYGWYEVDLAPFLGGEWVYLKLEHSFPQERGGCYGACLFRMVIEGDDDEELPVLQAVRTARPPRLDGNLGDPCWAGAPTAGTFSERFGKGQALSPTRARIAYDGRACYFSFRAESPHVASFVASARQHDAAVYADNCVEVFLLPPGSEHHYHMALNHAGVTFDERSADGPTTWESAAQTAVGRGADAWTAEIAIPWRSLGVAPPRPGDVWRLGLYRVDLPTGQFQNWSCVEGGGWHRRDRFGFVRFAGEALRPGVDLVVVPPTRLGEHRGRIALFGCQALDDAVLETALVTPDGPPRLQGRWTAAEVARSGRKGPGGLLTLDAAWRLAAPGKGYFTATIRHPREGVLSRAVVPFRLAPAQVAPLTIALQQPFYRKETHAVAVATANLPAADLTKATLSSVLEGQGARRATVSQQLRPGPNRVTVPLGGLGLGEFRWSFALRVRGRLVARIERKLARLRPLPGRPSVVTFRSDRTCLLNGRPYLPLGFLLVHSDEGQAEARRAMYAMGYRVSVTGYRVDEEFGRWLDAEHARGMLWMPELCGLLRGRNDFEGIRAVVSRWKDHPALFAWYLADEPEGFGDTPAILKRAYQAIKSIDRNHPVVVLTNAPGMFRFYRECADIVMADPYPVPGHPLSMVADWTRAARRGVADERPVWMTPQGFGWREIGSGQGNPPTPAEFRNMMAQCLIHGAKGIVWWPWSVPCYHHRTTFRALAAEVRALTPAVLHGRPPRGLPADAVVAGPIHYRVWEQDGLVWCLAANVSREAVDWRLPLPQALRPKGGVTVLFEGRRLDATGGLLRDAFEPAGVHAYRWTPAGRARKPTSLPGPARAF